MDEQEKSITSRRERMRRSLEVNTYWGIGNASCHDIEVVPTYSEPELVDGEPFYTIAVDVETGGLTVETGPTE